MVLKVTFKFQKLFANIAKQCHGPGDYKKKQTIIGVLNNASILRYLSIKSLTYRLKSSGSKIVPWGTPCFSSIQSDLTHFNETCCSLSLMKLLIKLMAEDEKLRDLSLEKDFM